MKRLALIFLFFSGTLLSHAEVDKELLSAYACFIKGEYATAISNFTGLLDNKNISFSDDLRFMRAKCYYMQGDFLKAKSDLQKLLNEDYSEANLLIAKTNIKLNSTSDIYFYLERYLNLNKMADINVIKSDTCFKNLFLTDAWFDFWQDKNDSELQELTKDIRYLIKSKNYTEALSKLDTKEESGFLNYLRSMVYFESENIPQAFTYINKALNTEPENITYLEQKALYLRHLSKYKEEIAIREKLTELIPWSFSNYLNLSECYYSVNENDKAREFADLLVEYFPDSPKYNLLFAKIQLQANDYLEALKTINKVLKVSEQSYDVLIVRGTVYYKMGTYTQAANDFSMSLDLKPTDAVAYFYLGNCNYKTGNSSAACYNWRKAAGYGSTDAIKAIIDYCQQ